MVKTLGRLLADDGGNTALEYALILGMLIGVSIMLLGTMGVSLKDIFDSVAGDLRRDVN
jgi:Flp pilus assembly pilin Flp